MIRKRKASGFTLIEVLISFGLLGLSLAGYQAISKYEAGANGVQDNRGRIASVRNYLRSFLNCGATLTPAAIARCARRAPIDMRQADGQILVAAAGSTVVGQRYQVTDRCSLSGSSASLSFAITDTISGVPAGKDLFDGIPLTCFVNVPPPTPNPVPPAGCTSGPTFLWLPAALQDKITRLLPATGYVPYYGVYPQNPNNQNPSGQPFTCMTGPYASPICQALLTDMATANPHYGLTGSFSPAYEVWLNNMWEWFPWYYDFDGGRYYQYAGLVFSGQPPYAWRFDVSGLAEDIIDGSIDVPSINGSLTVPATILETGANSGAPSFYPYYQMPMVIAWPNVTNGVFSIRITPVDTQGNNLGGAQCGVSIATESPIVLDLSGRDELKTSSFFASHARFDLAAEGSPRHTGWIRPPASFLALDLNRNGRIDDGSELFGTATRLPDGRRAANGYAALAQYDSRKKGFLDASDPIFERLLVWTDENGDGISQPWELRRLSEVGIRKIGIAYERVPDEMRKREHSGNVLRYRARVWGPARCGDAGCWSYDVYFRSERQMTRRFP